MFYLKIFSVKKKVHKYNYITMTKAVFYMTKIKTKQIYNKCTSTEQA